MSSHRLYTTQLGAGLGRIHETNVLFDYWEPSMSAMELYETVLDVGAFPDVSARRLRNIVAECFAPRYLKGEPAPALYLKQFKETFSASQLNQLYFLFTCRANHILADFIRDVYWDRYQSGNIRIENTLATDFIIAAMEEGKTSKRWSNTTVKRISAYLMGACGDYGLLGSLSRSGREINPYRLDPKVATAIAYILHFEGINDTALMKHEDWRLFGLTSADVREELKRISLQGYLIFQSAASISKISWHYSSMQELVDVLAES